MDSKTIITLVVSGIVIIAGLSIIMIPMISDMTDNIHSTDTNPNNNTYSLAESHTENIIEIVNNKLKINGEPYDFDGYAWRTIMFTDSFFVIKSTSEDVDIITVVASDGTKENYKKIHLKDNVATLTDLSNVTTTLDYELCMIWSEHGKYQSAFFNDNTTYYVNGDSMIYVAGGNNTVGGVFAGTVDNLRTVFKIGDVSVALNSSQHTTNPDVLALSGITSNMDIAALFIPKHYDVVSPTDEMMKLMFNISPVLIGLMFMAALGMVMVRSTKL